MKLTFAQLVSDLDTAGAFPEGATTAEKKGMTNEALEAIILSGRWNGTQVPLSMSINSDAELTLPHNFQTIEGVKVDGSVRDLASPWYSYLPGTSDVTQWSTNVRDLGDGYCSFAGPSAPAQFRVVSVGAPTSSTGSTVEIHGYDATGAEVWTGTQRGVVVTFGATKTGAFFSNIRAVIKPVTPQTMLLYACYADGTEEIIGIYEPGETVPSLRRYFVPELADIDPNNLSSVNIMALCRRRFVRMVADNDISPISNFRAWKNAVAHIHWENEGDETRSDKHLDTALKYLNKELKLLRPPSELGAVRVNAIGFGATGIRSFR